MGLANEGTGKLFRRSEKAVESFEEHFCFCSLCIHPVLLPVSWNRDTEGLMRTGSGDRVERTHGGATREAGRADGAFCRMKAREPPSRSTWSAGKVNRRVKRK